MPLFCWFQINISQHAEVSRGGLAPNHSLYVVQSQQNVSRE